jgi:hypothetical protein
VHFELGDLAASFSPSMSQRFIKDTAIRDALHERGVTIEQEEVKKGRTRGRIYTLRRTSRFAEPSRLSAHVDTANGFKRPCVARDVSLGDQFDLCLDSGGGSFIEALKVVEYLLKGDGRGIATIIEHPGRGPFVLRRVEKLSKNIRVIPLLSKIEKDRNSTRMCCLTNTC